MTSTDAFAVQNSNLNPFLFADVGTELNGSTLTILSILARLGQDPWLAAAKLVNMPKAAAITSLAQSIGKMPLGEQALTETDATAARLIVLLPSQEQTPAPRGREATTVPTMPKWVPIAFVCASVLMGMAVSMTSPPVATAGVATPVAQTIDRPAAVMSK